jgi:hypothetical protein
MQPQTGAKQACQAARARGLEARTSPPLEPQQPTGPLGRSRAAGRVARPGSAAMCRPKGLCLAAAGARANAAIQSPAEARASAGAQKRGRHRAQGAVPTAAAGSRGEGAGGGGHTGARSAVRLLRKGQGGRGGTQPISTAGKDGAMNRTRASAPDRRQGARAARCCGRRACAHCGIFRARAGGIGRAGGSGGPETRKDWGTDRLRGAQLSPGPGKQPAAGGPAFSGKHAATHSRATCFSPSNDGGPSRGWVRMRCAGVCGHVVRGGPKHQHVQEQ